jgi:hypothetical protein
MKHSMKNRKLDLNKQEDMPYSGTEKPKIP